MSAAQKSARYKAPLGYVFLNYAEFVRPRVVAVWCATALICLGSPLLSNDKGSRSKSQSARETGPRACKHAALRTGGKVITVGERDDGKEVTLSLSDTLEIRLTSVPGTGYGWKLAGPPPEFLCLEDERLDVGGAAVAGAAATSILRFIPVRPGAKVIKLLYVRSWEKDVPPKKTYTLPVRVR